MARPPISDAVVDTVKEIWANDPRQNATQVHTVVKRRLGPGAVSLRKVQQVVAELKKRGPADSSYLSGGHGKTLTQHRKTQTTSFGYKE